MPSSTTLPRTSCPNIPTSFSRKRMPVRHLCFANSWGETLLDAGESATQKPSNSLVLEDNNELAFVRFAELGIDKLLDGEDIAEIQDQKSIYTYLTTYTSHSPSSSLLCSWTLTLPLIDSILARFDGANPSIRSSGGHSPAPSLGAATALGGSRLSQSPNPDGTLCSSCSI